MTEEFWSGKRSRGIVARIVVEGDLVLQTPAHFGNGDSDDLTEMPLLVDPYDGKSPLLTGASLAGALRSYLRVRERGYLKPLPNPNDAEDGAAVKGERQGATVKLFGGFRADDEGEQSALIIDDARGKEGTFSIEMREGVKISPRCRTAEEEKLFHRNLWRSGTTFPLRLELLICHKGNEQATKAYADLLKRALATALQGFNDGGITLGSRKRRGYGGARVAEWRVTSYDLTSTEGLLAWVAGENPDLGVTAPAPQTGGDLAALLGVTELGDARQEFTLAATFALDGSLLIRSGSGQDDQGPDTVHLHSIRVDSPRDDAGKPKPVPILSGTSLAGALRARALRIGKTLAHTRQPLAEDLVDHMWGADTEKLKKRRTEGDMTALPYASRISVQETPISADTRVPLVQNRIRIDRFTGGAFETALFSEEPIFSDGKEKAISVTLTLREPRDFEIGLLLLVLKDLWTGDLPLGGESSIGRGRLRGLHADLELRRDGDHSEWTLDQAHPEEPVVVGRGTKGDLEAFVTALRKKLSGTEEETP